MCNTYVDNVLENDCENDFELDFVQYDTEDEIQMCLNCAKPECDNCLKTINGV